MADAQTEIHSVLDTWAKAELAADVATLDGLLTDDFAGIGPFGFTLVKSQWLDRHREQSLIYTTFSLEDAETVIYGGGSTAVVRGRQVAEGAYYGNPVPLEHRVTIVLDRRDEGWKLVAFQLSFIMGTQGAPAMPRPDA